MSELKPWAYGPFELLIHAELHLRTGKDFDKRMAHIGFDNAIELSITTYLNLPPKLRGKRSYRREDVENWLQNYHSRLRFLESELTSRKIDPVVPIDEIIWYHTIRNSQYHDGSSGVPEERSLEGIRTAALWIFSFLFEINEMQEKLEEQIMLKEGLQQNEDIDRYLDDFYGVFEVASGLYSASEIIFKTDPSSYTELRDSYSISDSILEELKEKYPPSWINPDLSEVQLVHLNNVVYLKTSFKSGETEMTEIDHLILRGLEDGELATTRTVDENVAVFIEELNPAYHRETNRLFREDKLDEMLEENTEKDVVINIIETSENGEE